MAIRVSWSRARTLQAWSRQPNFDPRELNYYSKFKLSGGSYVQHLVDELKAGEK